MIFAQTKGCGRREAARGQLKIPSDGMSPRLESGVPQSSTAYAFHRKSERMHRRAFSPVLVHRSSVTLTCVRLSAVTSPQVFDTCKLDAELSLLPCDARRLRRPPSS